MKQKETGRPPIPEGAEGFALADIEDVCGVVRMSQSWVRAEVKNGRFPAPVIQERRCTRWRLADVRRWVEQQQQAEVA